MVGTRAIVASVIVAACAACVSTQDLGAWSSGDDAGDGGSTTSAASSPREGFVLPVANKSCPASAPTQGDPCSAASGECIYDTRDLAQLGQSVCGRTCACALGGNWICVDAHCPELDVNNCHEGVACVGDLQCWVNCDRPGDSCLRCTCTGGRLSCSGSEGPPK